MKAHERSVDFHYSHNPPLGLDHPGSKVFARFVVVSTFPQRSSQQQGSFDISYLEKSCFEDGLCENPGALALRSFAHFHNQFRLVYLY
jgi:hypothetical protein